MQVAVMQPASGALSARALLDVGSGDMKPLGWMVVIAASGLLVRRRSLECSLERGKGKQEVVVATKLVQPMRLGNGRRPS